MKVDNYQVLEQIAATDCCALFLARHIPTGAVVLLKLPASESAAACLRQEYALLQSLAAQEVLKPLALLDASPHLALVLEAFGTEGLDAALARQPDLSLTTTLTIVLQAARAIAALHAAGIVHHDIRPANFLLAHAWDNAQLKLADLSRATLRDDLSARTTAGGDWAYVSPEQTGRMNRHADYRTDFYSLGIMLYQLLTGRLPFQADDPLEWVHCHLARVPVPPHELAPAVPPAVSDLALKLLAKAPEERYQSANGLLADLEQCLAEWQAAGAIARFTLGRRDVTDRFHIPLKLYGRERETAVLLAAFDSVATTGTPAMVTVAGYSGVGKSALIHGLRQPVAARHGYFIAGKFDQYQRDIPYVPLVQAFDGLVRQILGESEAAIGNWRQKLLAALEANAQLMVSLIPRLELVIGPGQPVSELPPHQAQNRFQLVFRRFVGVFATQEHPLLLFLDDLQWVDAGTLAALSDLATHPEVRHLLLIGAYRDNEVDSNHPLSHGLASIRERGGAVQDIMLRPLALDDLAQLIAETLRCPHTEAQPLAQLVSDKTGGNPFFARQFLGELAEEKLLQFDAGQGAWHWDLPRIKAKCFTDNVADLMVAKLARLPQETQTALARFACLGNASDAATLCMVLQQSVDAVHAMLGDAEQAGLVFRQDARYRFQHDRVQEACYSLIPEAARAAMHLRIGRLLRSSLAPGVVAERIFEVVGQLNRGSELVDSQEEREWIAELNLMAGRRAKEATAYASALTYFTTGARLIAGDGWERRYDLAFWLAFHHAECEYLTGSTTDAERHLAALSSRAANEIDQASVVRLRMDICMAHIRPDGAISLGLDYLRHLGIEWSIHPTEAEVLRECERIWSNLGNRAIEDLVDLPLATDAALLATLDVLIGLVPPAAYTDPNLTSLLICRAVNLSLEHGNGDASCFAYTHLATVLGLHFGDYRNGARFGRLGYGLVERKGLRRFEVWTSYVFGRMVLPWTSPLRESSDVLQRATKAALRSGDFTTATWCRNGVITTLLAAGGPLADLQHELEQLTAFGERYGETVLINSAQTGLVRTLRGLAANFGLLLDDEVAERGMEEHLSINPALVFAECGYWILKLLVRYFSGNYAAALHASSHAAKTLWPFRAFLEAAEYHFYSALTRAACCDFSTSEQRKHHLDAIALHMQQLHLWAESCPETFESRLLLVEAEYARLEERGMDAQRLYERAIRSARDNGFVNNEALANELAAGFCLGCGLETSGLAYLRNARACYARWGADGKVRQLDERFPHLRVRRKSAASAGSPGGEARLDLLAVAKASQAISGRILLDELVDTLMRIVLESAGAQTGCLLLAQGDELLLAAEATIEEQALRLRRQAAQTPQQDQLPLTLLQYVRRSREPVLLMDASAPHQFSADPYFAHQPPQSALCLPILRQTALVGLLYLENRLAAQAFSPERIQVLELLASQAAISLENARLYADVRDSHARIRRLVESNIIGILFWDLSGHIIDANDAFLDMVGYSRQELLSGELNWERMTPPEYRELDARNVAQLLVTGACAPFEKEYVRKDGSRFPILIGVALFEQSRDTGVAFVLDLTERRRAETERQARQAAESANRAKSVFLANISHELRTPLNSILGYAQILEQDPSLDIAHAAKATVIRKSGEHLLTLINDILDLAKIEAGKMELYPEEIFFQSFVRDIVDIARVKAVDKGLDLVCDVAPDVPQTVRADEKRLRQILLNLLSNAIKFTERGEVALRARFTLPDRLCLDVADTGVGIAASQLESIFEPFEQAGDRLHRSGGTGLGLTISRQYARLMGGDIQVESQPGEGSIFRVEIRAQPMHEATGPTATSAAGNVTGYAGPRKRILVVDDIAENRSVMADLLTPLGFEVSEACNGREGLEAAERLRPDLILMDIAMPQLDGLSAVRLLRQSDNGRDVPVIAVSASVSASDSEHCLAAGMNAFVPKPLDAHKLLEQTAKLLKLEWTYGAPHALSEADAQAAPPVEEMEVLYRLARLGNMQEIMAQAKRLAALDERYRPFADRLTLLAKDYQSKAVLQFVEAHWQGDFVTYR